MALVRARFEASASTEEGVRDDLASAVSAFRDLHGGEWGYDGDGEQLQRTRDGHWGYVTIRRKDEAQDQARA